MTEQDFLKIVPGSIPVAQFHAHMLGSIAPRPIALASTIDAEGNPNLSPFSFFNAMGANPPVMVFSPARRVRDNTTKHTLQNILATKEVVINAVSYDMVEQISLASCEYPTGVNEFIKSGLTPIPSETVKPYGVLESPVRFECEVLQVIETGSEGGAGNIIVCRAKLMHIRKNILDNEGRIDPQKIQLVARMGGDWYAKAFGDAVFEVPKPNIKLGIGMDNLPDAFFQLGLSKNELARLANIEAIPNDQDLTEALAQVHMQEFEKKQSTNSDELKKIALEKGREALQRGNLLLAWALLKISSN